MIHVMGVRQFSGIMWHIGIDSEDTEGCLLVGDKQRQNKSKKGMLEQSTDAYKRLYNIVAPTILSKEGKAKVVYLTIG